MGNSLRYLDYELPEDPAYSTPDESNFLFFLGVTSRILCATVYFFFSTISGPFSNNLDRDIGPRIRFFEFFSGYIVPGLFAKISSKNRF
jgi:hypothetical protein